MIERILSIHPLLLLAIAFLIGAVVFDFKTRKVPNYYTYGFVIYSAISALYLQPSEAWLSYFTFAIGAWFFFSAFIFYFRILGAGDLKLLAGIALLTGANGLIDNISISFIWALLLGLVQVLLQGQLWLLLLNVKAILQREKREKLNLHTLPFTVPILLAYVQHLIFAIVY